MAQLRVSEMGRSHVAKTAGGAMTREEKGGSMLDDYNADHVTVLPGGAPAKTGLAAMRARGRRRMGGGFLEAIQADFEAHGVAVVARIREEKPESYLKLVASILPKDFSAAAGRLEDLSDEQLIDRIRVLDAAIRPLLNKRKSSARRSGRAPRAEQVDSSAKPE